MPIKLITIDFEVTNRCNADCHFCPRDKTPHQGLMEPDVFEQTLARAIEFRDGPAARAGVEVRVSLCGLGEPLLNKHLPDYVRRVKEAGFFCAMSSNGALLDEKRAKILLDAGLDAVHLNVGERGEEYEKVYRLRWQKTYENVVRFAEMARNRCTVSVVLVDYHGDSDRIAAMKAFWSENGIDLHMPLGLINRGGSLEIDQSRMNPESLEAATASFREHTSNAPVCSIAFVSTFVGYDGQHYLCCSDWTKTTPMGSVFERSFEDVLEERLAQVLSREPICKSCNLDPINALAFDHGAKLDGEINERQFRRMARRAATVSDGANDLLEALGVSVEKVAAAEGSGGSRKRLPLVS